MPTSNGVTREGTIADAMERVKLSEDTVRRDIRRGAPHSKERGQIRLNLDEYVAWRETQGLTGSRGRPKSNDSPDMETAKLEKLREEIRIKRAQADRDERRA